VLNGSAKVTVNGANSDIHGIKVGDRATVTLEEANSRVASQVAVTRRSGDQGNDHPRPIAHDRSSQDNRSSSSSYRGSDSDHDRPALGVVVGESHQGIEVQKVRPDSAAQKAGIRQGDILIKVADTEIATEEQFTDALHGKKPGDRVSIVVERNGKEKTVTAKLTSRHEMFQSAEEDRNNQMSSNDRSRNNQQGNRGTWSNQQQHQGRAWLGIRMKNGNSDQQPEGVWIQQVFPNGPAGQAGIREGDEILSIDGERVNHTEDVGSILDEHASEHQLRIEIVRNGQRRTLPVTLGNSADYEHHFYQSGYANEGQSQGNNQEQSGYDAMDHHTAMMGEFYRHHGMQNQRLEQRLDQLMNEVQQLRQQVHHLQMSQQNNDVNNNNR
jgi:serine protease Do